MSGRDRVRRPGLRELARWLAAGAALSPVLLELAGSARELRASPSVLLAPWLFALYALRVGMPRREPRAAGLVLVAAGLALQGVGLASDIGSLARLGLPCVVMGVAAISGRPAASVAALAFWLVPPPTALLVQASPGAEAAIAQLASLPFRALGLAVEALGPVVRTGAERLDLTAYQTGIPLLLLLAELGWYAGLRAGCGAPGLFARALAGAAAALPLQVLAVAAAVALLLAGGAQAARVWLDHGLGLAVAVGGAAWIEWRHASGGRRSRSARTRGSAPTSG